MYTVIYPAEQDDRNYVLNSASGSVLKNLTAGSTSSIVTSIASKQLALLAAGSPSLEVLNALATQLHNETAGTTEALLLQAGLSKAEVKSIKQACAKLDSEGPSTVELTEFAHGTAASVSSSTAAEVVSITKSTKVKKK